ncbi:alpha/beta fold hydrolase [Nisaea nitritireducens]|uniref:alpha/beta fold hydrolase n=1 Tax=Nisaea nitritireducens TaxID=568392 RepID=UPI001D01E734|nr:alpha/beta hydrolase [Nisaea nitritireducens]
MAGQGYCWDEAGATGSMRIGGAMLEAYSVGPPPGEAPTMVLLHEGLGCVDLWRDFPRRLFAETGCGVFAYSRAGYGRSDACPLPRPLDYMTREAVSVLPEVLDTIGFEDGMLIGHSDGASIAAIHAGAQRDPRVRAVVLMAPHFFTEAMGLAAIAEARTAYADGDLRARLGKYHMHVDAAFRGWNGAWLDPGFKEWNIRDYLDQVTVPVLCLQGEGDQYGTRAQVDVVAQRAPGPVTIRMIPECRHSPHLEAPEIVQTEIAVFLEGLPAKTGQLETGVSDA